MKSLDYGLKHHRMAINLCWCIREVNKLTARSDLNQNARQRETRISD